MELGFTLVGIYNTANKWPASRGTTDAIWVTNDQYNTRVSLDKAYHLVWNGNAFSASYTDEYLDENNRRMITVVDLSGEFSSNYKTLISFTGTRTMTKQDLFTGGGSDIVEQRLEVHDVPVEVDTNEVIALIHGNAQKYVTSAYWRHTTIDPSTTVTSETGDLDFSDPSTQLTVSFNKVY
jgi:hypothetical protein